MTRPYLQSDRHHCFGGRCAGAVAAGSTLRSRDVPLGTGANSPGACDARPLARAAGSLGSRGPCSALCVARVAFARAGRPCQCNRPAAATAAWARTLSRMRCTTSFPCAPPLKGWAVMFRPGKPSASAAAAQMGDCGCAREPCHYDALLAKAQEFQRNSLGLIDLTGRSCRHGEVRRPPSGFAPSHVLDAAIYEVFTKAAN